MAPGAAGGWVGGVGGYWRGGAAPDDKKALLQWRREGGWGGVGVQATCSGSRRRSKWHLARPPQKELELHPSPTG